MTFHFVTLFPEAIHVWLTTSIIGRAHAAGRFQFNILQLRDYAHDRHRSVDDVAYGGGGGMVLRVEPLVAVLEDLFTRVDKKRTLTVYFSPSGRRLRQEILEEYEGRFENFILVCGHYEGVDQRFLDRWIDVQLSLGDFVLTGGELPAVAFVDAFVRRLDGALGPQNSHERESFSLRDPDTGGRLLEHPHYTRPADFRGLQVPPILLSGNHEAIERWRLEKARELTRRGRSEN